MSPTHFLTLLAAIVLLGLPSSGSGQGAQRRVPLAEIYSGKALNDLLDEIATAHSHGQKGPAVVLDAALLRRINVGPPDGGNFGLLAAGTKLTWPKVFRQEKLQGVCVKVEAMLMRARTALQQDPTKPIAKSVLVDVAVGGIRILEITLDQDVNDLTPSQYIEGRRYLHRLRDAVTALKNPNAERFVDGTFAARGQSVAELTDYLRRQELRFNAAVDGQEEAYRSLFESLKAYHAGLGSR
jgi:hypothetical protein